MGLGIEDALGLGVDLRVSWSFLEIKDIINDSLLSLDSNLGLKLEQVAHPTFLLADEWHRLKLILPFLGQDDGVILDFFALHCEPLGIGMLNNLLHLIWEYCVPHIEEVTLITL